MAACHASQYLSVLQYVPVDTIICFRASCPIVIAIIEFFYLGRELPSLRSWASLIGENSAPLQRNIVLHYIHSLALYAMCCAWEAE